MAPKKKKVEEVAIPEEAAILEAEALAAAEAVAAEENVEVVETVEAVEAVEVEDAPEVEEMETFSTDTADPIEATADADGPRDLTDFYDDDEPLERRERKYTDFTGSKLSWLVEDFHGVTDSVYEAVMVAAHRARQVGRRQKREIDAYNSSQVLTPESIEAEEHSEKGVDHFQHIKPTVAALDELKNGEFEYYYLDEKK